ncbi:MAG: hypothetical protein O2816_07480 [Planctomycetota bacterium]|nr:hypothetical protein [Planctomycetota bacterium]
MSALALTLVLVAAPAADPQRQFDFWIGEWLVQNRDWQADGSWKNGDVTRARITPVIDGAAILEEWAGPLRGGFMNGFSLRAWDPSAEHWDLLLFWTMDGNGGFGQLQGSFRHGRGEFLSSWSDSEGEVTQRYSFSDALPDSVRWDSATTRDRGRTWHTDWIMEFTRTRAASEMTEDRLFGEHWTEGKLSPHASARKLDGMLGEWTGEQVRGRETSPARLRCKLLDKDCLVLDSLEVQRGDEWDKRLAVRGFSGRRRAWESWHVAEEDTRLLRSFGAPSDGQAVFEREDAGGQVTWRETLQLTGDSLTILEEALVEGELRPRALTTLQRAE